MSRAADKDKYLQDKKIFIRHDIVHPDKYGHGRVSISALPVGKFYRLSPGDKGLKRKLKNYRRKTLLVDTNLVNFWAIGKAYFSCNFSDQAKS